MEREREVKKVTTITKEDFLNFLDAQQEHWENVLMTAQSELFRIYRTKQKIDNLEERGFRISFFTDGETCFFEARKKEPIGFKGGGENETRS